MVVGDGEEERKEDRKEGRILLFFDLAYCVSYSYKSSYSCSLPFAFFYRITEGGRESEEEGFL